MIKNNGFKVWIDIVNTPQIHFFKSLLDSLKIKNIHITLRDKGECVELASQYKFKYDTIGADFSNPYLKSIGILHRTMKMFYKIPKFDVSLCFQNGMCSLISKSRRKKCIMFDDNDYRIFSKGSIPLKLFIKSQALADYYIVPRACYETFSKIIDTSKLYYHDGYKENISIADYVPNELFPRNIPFKEYVVIRPEAFDALYVKSKETLVPELLKLITRENLGVVLLSRNRGRAISEHYSTLNENIFIPTTALNGLDLCYYSKAVLTGSGTMAREAACMGKTAISFFPHNNLLSVDKDLINKGRLLHSRNADEIVNHILNNLNKNVDFADCLANSNNIRKDVSKLICNIIKDIK